ncbi:MAG: tetrapyrrole methylase family protein / MazG family protein [Chloroflexota bacterium]|jgi:tetrapyrrole methylase family protein/MazG family protein|nr:tetrapyrrole methylase family protein / MazG family protein [Chloroflexota bacterium]
MDELLARVETRFGVTAADGLQLLSLHTLVARPFDPGMALVIVPGKADAGTPIPGRAAHGASPAALLQALYPSDHPLHPLPDGQPATAGTISDEALSGTSWLVPALEPLANLASPYALPWLVARLRAPDGCPWDREQDHMSLRKFLLEETYEVYDALEGGSTPQLAEELGDLLLQVILHAQYGAEDGVFDMADVHRAVVTKIVRRHPHVFGDAVADSATDVLRNWEQIKAGERAERSAAGGESVARDEDMPEAFAGLARSLPALAYAQEMQERAALLGYDWPSLEGVLDKVKEEAAEIIIARDDSERREELGDLLLVLVNMARKLGIDSEAALRQASAKFAKRFAGVERIAAERGVDLKSLTLDELDELWQQAKRASKVGAT